MKKLLLILTILLGFSTTVLAADKVKVYYFFGKPRCATCVKIETYTKDVVKSMDDNDVTYQGIDMQNSENDSLVKKYNLYNKSVILSKTKNGKEQWKNLDQIWLKVKNEQDFKNYITTEIKKFKGKK
jgi:thiol-disulfide isomerase/thioredoxin